MIPYGRHSIDDDDIAAVTEVLRSDWLTTGPAVASFERTVADYLGAPHAVAVNTGTAALHAAMAVLGIGPGDEVIVPCLTFVATANAAVYQGARPVFADIDPATLLIDPVDVARRITPRTKAIVGVDYAGQPCDWSALRAIAAPRGIPLVADGCHALGARRDDIAVGRLADLTALSFHPVKHVTTAEGGMLIALDLAHDRMARAFRSHGIDTDWRERAEKGAFSYAMTSLGWNYRLPDLNCALGISQMKKLERWLVRRRAIAAAYDRAFTGANAFTPLVTERGVEHAYHLYVIRLDSSYGAVGRADMHARLRARGVGANVHYPVVHLHPFYRERFATGPGLCPAGEQAADLILTLPLHQGMTDAEVTQVIDAVLTETRARAA